MNTYQKKNIIYSVVLLSLVAIVWLFRQSNEEDAAQNQVTFSGQTMGTVYNIKYLDDEGRSFKNSIDSLLEVYNQSLNHYLSESEISKFGKEDTFYFDLPYFYPVLKRSQEISAITGGAYDPTIAPLVDAWGFGPGGGELPDSLAVDSLLQLVDYTTIEFTKDYVSKTKPNVELNFSAIAKGYGVDVIADFLEEQGIENMMVEIGGEILCKGKNSKGEYWRIGIDDPEQKGDMPAIITLKDQAIATSGNYRNYYVRDGKKYAHTIDPVTGYPVNHSVLSVSVLAEDCLTADAFATAFMVMGLEKSKKILEENDSLDAFIIYDNEGSIQTFQTEGMEDNLVVL